MIDSFQGPIALVAGDPVACHKSKNLQERG